MKLLLLSGFGPTWPSSSFWDGNALAGTFFDRKNDVPHFHTGLGRRVAADDLHYRTKNGESRPLLRGRQGSEPHLTTETLGAILDAAGHSFELFRLEDVWQGDRSPSTASPDVILLSTTFICNWRAMQMAVDWVEKRFPAATLVVGGQFSNLKYTRILRELPKVDFVVRGDAEVALPSLLAALGGNGDLGKVPNLVFGGTGGRLRQIHANDHEYIDLDRHPSPRFKGNHRVTPYESMRGCPFSCRFCSFPAASPKWRYKSADKIVSDWTEYAEKNGAQLIRALDSTFTVPPPRLRELFDKLPSRKIPWDAYTRANVVVDKEFVERLEATHCVSLSIGFESMSESSLKRMHKQVSARQNRRANALLADSGIDFRGSFMIGYPGETPDDYKETHDFLVNEYSSHFLLNPFSLIDETMPVWEDKDLYRLELANPDNPDSDWSHIGMTTKIARELHEHTIREVRWKNDRATASLWQVPYDRPIVPGVSHQTTHRIEKLLERLAFAPVDFASEPERVRQLTKTLMAQLDEHGVFVASEARAAG